MKPFAKLYQNEEIGQVLATLHLTGEDTPEIHIHFDPEVEGIGLSATKIGFPDTEEGEGLARQAFDSITEESAIGVAQMAIANIRTMFSGAGDEPV